MNTATILYFILLIALCGCRKQDPVPPKGFRNGEWKYGYTEVKHIWTNSKGEMISFATGGPPKMIFLPPDIMKQLNELKSK